VPLVGTAAAIGLIVFFVCAAYTHIRVSDYSSTFYLGPASSSPPPSPRWRSTWPRTTERVCGRSHCRRRRHSPGVVPLLGGMTNRPAMHVLRTPDDRFDDLPGYPFDPHYAEIDAGDGHGTTLRAHYVDESAGQPSGETVLLLHGEPTWSYLWRNVIPPLVAAGHRCVAPDLVGFGRSDKPTDRFDYTYQSHIDWLRRLVFDVLDLDDITLVCHDWGGLLGLRLLAEHPGRFRRVVATNTMLPAGDQDMGPFFLFWLQSSQRSNPFSVGEVVTRNHRSGKEIDPRVLAAYDAPFPGEPYLQGARQFPLLVPISPQDEAAGPNRDAWAVLERLEISFLCAYGELDPVSRVHGEKMAERIPGAKGQPHVTIPGAGHFVQEDQPGPLTQAIADFIAGRP
jgi:haloalkane dehalogenase